MSKNHKGALAFLLFQVQFYSPDSFRIAQRHTPFTDEGFLMKRWSESAMADFSEVGAYQLKERIGRGGMAEVFRAEDPRIQRSVAVKIINPEIADDPTFRKRFAQEINLIAKLEHSGIVPLYDVGEAYGRPYLVMRYMPNGTLADRIEAGAIPLAEAIPITTRLAAALDFAHTHGIVHRDLKPGNILLDKEGEPYIADFGISKLVGQSNTQTLSRTGMTMGTPAYMSPEQFRGESALDGRADVYALGVLLFQMLSGELPFNADTPHGLMYHHLESPVPDIRTLRPEFPTDLSLVLQQALAKRREARYSTAGAFARDLQLVAEGKSVTPLPTTSAAHLLTVPLPSRPARAVESVPATPLPPIATSRNFLPWVAVGIIAILLVGGALLAPTLFGNATATTAEAAPTATVAPNPTESSEEAIVVIEPTEEPEEPDTGIIPSSLVASDADFLIYDDELQNDFENWSWIEVGLENDDPVYEQEYSIWVENPIDYGAVWFMNPNGAVETSEFVALRFAIHGGEEGGQILLVGLSNNEEFPVSPHGVPLNNYLPEGPIANTWREVTIPLSDLVMEDDLLYSVAFQSDVEEEQSYFYIDDIRLIAAP
jgi:serine/threonine protein kinase